MTEVAIMSACRTPLGSFGGTLANVSAVELASIVIREAVERSGIVAEQVDEVLLGSVLTAGLGQNVARQAAIRAGLPESTVASTLNNVCGSGLKTLNLAAAMIRNGDAEIMVVGGTENMSAAPYLLECHETAVSQIHSSEPDKERACTTCHGNVGHDSRLF